MASVFRRVRTSSIPPNAEIVEQAKATPKAAKIKSGIAVWKDRDGIPCGGPVLDGGSRYFHRVAQWIDESGVEQRALVSPEGNRITLGIDPSYSAKYRDSSGKWVRRSTGTSDKDAATRIAKQWEADERLQREGVINQALVKQNAELSKSISDQLQAYIDHLATKAGTQKHRNRVKMHVSEFVTFGKWKSLRDIDSDSVARHAAAMLKAKTATRTVQARLRSVKGFTRWLTDQNKLTIDPLRGIKPPSPKTDRKRERRMLLPDEWRWLRDAALKTDRYGLSGAERVLIYETAIQTGLRCSELASLDVGKLQLDSDAPHILCKAADTKNRKQARQYIDKRLASEIKRHIAGKGKSDQVFGVPVWDTAKMLQADLDDARSLWLASGGDATNADFLAVKNSEGRF